MKAGKTAEDGVTLTELLIATLIFVGATVALFPAIVSSNKTVTQTVNSGRDVAYHLAGLQLDSCYDFIRSTSSSPEGELSLCTALSSVTAGKGATYSMSFSSTDVGSGSSLRGYKKGTATVTWLN